MLALASVAVPETDCYEIATSSEPACILFGFSARLSGVL